MSFAIQKNNIFAVPVLHYSMEFAMQAKLAFETLKPDCVVVELSESMEKNLIRAAARLPDISVVENDPLYYLCEPCDAAFEALRSAIELGLPAYCIDLDVADYPQYRDKLPDPYSLTRIGLEKYYGAFLDHASLPKHPLDRRRELHMARRLKELSFSYERILFIGGISHIHSILELIDSNSFPSDTSSSLNDSSRLATLTEESCRDALAECGWISTAYEQWRTLFREGLLDRQKLIYTLYKSSAERYVTHTGNPFPNYQLRNMMKFARNYALLNGHLLPNLYEILAAAKGCADHNYAYEVWFLATHYPFRKNIDNLPELNLTVEQIWGHSKLIKFHLKQKRRKGYEFQLRRKDKSRLQFHPPSTFSICSYPPEDLVVEKFGDFLKKKGKLLLRDAASKTQPFSSSLEDGIDVRETIRHFSEKKLYVKTGGPPPGTASSVVMIFNADMEAEKYTWKTTWLGEHNQESDMAFYATPTSQNVVGPGISRCEYGGFMLSSPPCRLYDVWSDPDYEESLSPAETLLMAAIDYAIHPIVIYVAEKAPRAKIKSFANRFGKKIQYIPIKQLSPIMLNKIRTFHVLDGRSTREIAGDYIF